jgi:hypothetical protein
MPQGNRTAEGVVSPPGETLTRWDGVALNHFTMYLFRIRNPLDQDLIHSSSIVIQ